jgi:hypothetical protein
METAYNFKLFLRAIFRKKDYSIPLLENVDRDKLLGLNE